MPARIKDHTKEFNRRLRKATSLGLERAAIFYHTKARQAVSISANPVKRKRKRATSAGKKGSQYTTYTKPSTKGQPPRLRTGVGLSNVIWEHNNNERKPAVRIGSKKGGMHLIWLELDVNNIGKRPWLVATLRKHWDQISRLAVTGGKRHLP